MDFYEQKERVKDKLHLLDADIQEEFKQTKKQLDGFIDGLIETLSKEFGETRVSPYSSRREKMDYLKRLVKELDDDTYSDTHTLFKMIGENQEQLLRATVGGER